MNPISFKDVANLVNRISGTQIDVDAPRVMEPEQYAVYAGSVSGSGFSFEFEILYLYADLTKEGVRGARAVLSRIQDKSKVRVVYAPSITASLIEDVRRSGVPCISLAEYFRSFMTQQSEAYIKKIQKLSFENYINPQIETPRGFVMKNPNPVLGFMMMPEQSTSKGDIAVLLGEPGQGKTHMSKFLAVELTKGRTNPVIPVYVHSEQWAKMQVDDLSSIWKTIVASFRYFDAPIAWAEGVEREFIQVSLRLGIFRLIFDGFDEFILWNRGTIDPRDSLQELLALAEETGTTLCITSRTSFWRAETVEIEGDVPITGKGRLYEFIICPFDVNHARNYFTKRFEITDKSGQSTIASVKLFESLKQDTSDGAMNFVGRGFFLSLIADLVSRGFGVEGIGVGNQTRLQWIMDALCQREQVRQGLPLDAATQLNVLREFAEITATGEPRSHATLRIVLEAVGDLDSDQVDLLIKNPAKLKDHPLIGYMQRVGSWYYKQDQIEYVLLGEKVLELCSSPARGGQLNTLLNSAGFSKNLQIEVATSIVQQVFELGADNEALDRCKEIITAISHDGTRDDKNDAPNGCYQFAGRVALLAAAEVHTMGSDRADRTNTLLNLLPGGQLVGLQFVGTISGLDLRDLTISRCHFDAVTFANCRFSDTTRFENCRFTDLRATNCDQFGRVVWDTSNRYDEVSYRLVDAEVVTTGRKSYAEKNLIADLDCLIKRFLPRETSGFKNVEEKNITRGLIGHSMHKAHIIESFKRHCLNSHPISGNEVYSVIEKVKADFIFYVGNGMLTGELATMKDELSKKIGLNA